MFQDLKFVVKEAVQNAIEHGNQGDPRKALSLSWRLSDASLCICVSDSGPGFDPSVLPDPTADQNLFKPRGRGIYLLRKMMDEVSFNDRGNTLEMVKNLPRS